MQTADMTTAADLLTATNTAILETLTAQEYQGPANRQKKMARLSELQAFRASLMREVADASESDSGMCSLGIVEYDL